MSLRRRKAMLRNPIFRPNRYFSLNSFIRMSGISFYALLLFGRFSTLRTLSIQSGFLLPIPMLLIKREKINIARKNTNKNPTYVVK